MSVNEWVTVVRSALWSSGPKRYESVSCLPFYKRELLKPGQSPMSTSSLFEAVAEVVNTQMTINMWLIPRRINLWLDKPIRDQILGFLTANMKLRQNLTHKHAAATVNRAPAPQLLQGTKTKLYRLSLPFSAEIRSPPPPRPSSVVLHRAGTSAQAGVRPGNMSLSRPV